VAYVVSARTVVAAISVALLVWLILSFLLPPLWFPGKRQDPYDEVPTIGSGVIVDTGNDTFLTNITYDSIPFNLTWPINPNLSIARISPANPPRYWRQTAYDTYTGHDWQKTNTTTTALAPWAGGGVVVYTVTQNITHQLAGTLPLLALWPEPRIVQGSISAVTLPNPSSYDLETDSYSTALLNCRFSRAGQNVSLQYQVTYRDDVQPSQIRLAAQSASLTPPSLDIYRQGFDRLSAATRADILTRLNTILAGVPDNAFEQAFAVLDYFKATFGFDITVGRPGSSDEPVAWFLGTGRGIGLDFATAYTMFLRGRGIAARPVLGAVLGQTVGADRVLRLMHVHFWVEVYVPTSSTQGYWVQFDPTPLPSWITGPAPNRDPNVVSTYYDLTVQVPTPIVNRGTPFQVRATLTKDGVPEAGETISFFDETEQWLLGSNVTAGNGATSITFTYNNSAICGVHLLRVAFNAKSEYAGIGLHGPANLTLQVTPLEVNRTATIRCNGTLADAVNGRGLSSTETGLQGVNVTLGGASFATASTDAGGHYSVNQRVPASQAPLGLTTVLALFYLAGIIDPAAASAPQTLNITAQSRLSLRATPNAVRVNSNTTLSGQLRYENGTGIAARGVQLSWNGTFVGQATTDGVGDYFFNYTPTVLGQVTVRAQFLGANYVYGSAATVAARVHDEGTLVVVVFDSDGDNIVQRGTSVDYAGWVENQNGTRRGGIIVYIYLNGTQVASTVTFPNGTFRVQYIVATSLTVGFFEVTGDVDPASLLVVQSSVDYLTINSATQILGLQLNATRALLGEGILLRGQLVDDQGAGVTASPVAITLSYQTTTLPLGTAATLSDGSFQFTFTLPGGLPATVPSISLGTRYSGASYYGISNSSRILDISRGANLTIQVREGLYPANAIIPISGVLRDDFNRPLPGRRVFLTIDGREALSAITDDGGAVGFNLTILPPPQTTNYTIQLQHHTFLTIPSAERTITVEAAPMQGLGPIPLELIVLIAVVVIVVVVAVVFSRYWKRRPRRPAIPSIDASAMLSTLRQLLTDKKYRESVTYAFRMFETIAQAKLGVFRDPSITLREFGNLVVAQGRLDARGMGVFVRGVEEARFSDHEISYEAALTTLNAFATLYNQLTGGNLRFVTQEPQQQ
jgi:transglutaminase-like putative cysteine protease